MMYRVRGAILLGILLTSIISWPRGTPVTYFPHTDSGDALFDYFKNVVQFHKLQKIGNVIDVSITFMTWSGGSTDPISKASLWVCDLFPYNPCRVLNTWMKKWAYLVRADYLPLCRYFGCVFNHSDRASIRFYLTIYHRYHRVNNDSMTFCSPS